VASSLTVGAVRVVLADIPVRRPHAMSFTIFKIKTAAHPLADDLRRIEAIRAAVGPKVSLRVDANQGWPTSRASPRTTRSRSYGSAA
jgi:L-alanine-DL-glutamate epimerase-like enolase superfamily enzyme